MKKIIALLAISIAVSSCAAQYKETRYILDYRPFLGEGFSISPLPTFNEPHDILATIWLEVIPGKATHTVRMSDGAGGMIEKEMLTKKRKGYSVDENLEVFVNYAKDLGATGIIDLKSNVGTPGGVRVYELSGVAIRVKP